RFPSVLRFRLYQILAVPIFAGAIRPFGFFAVPTLADPVSFDSGSDFRRSALRNGFYRCSFGAFQR
ncbi:hypothetical protein, partial [Streptomyces lydicus]|uniref:hypothetical protein n=1 Tax=Streptomyces lydicus TaxID=47763 RepID=UPI0037A2097C